jgi:hypothetical protein
MLGVVRIGVLELLARLGLVEQQIADAAARKCLKHVAARLDAAPELEAATRDPRQGLQSDGGLDAVDDPDWPGMSVAGTGLKAGPW